MVYRYAVNVDAPTWTFVNSKPVKLGDYAEDGRYTSVFVPVSKGDVITVGRSPGSWADPVLSTVIPENILLLYFYPTKIY